MSQKNKAALTNEQLCVIVLNINDKFSDLKVKYEDMLFLQCEIWRAEHRC